MIAKAAVATPDVDLVNGGYGIKHPLLRHSDVNTRNLINAQQLGQADTFICNYSNIFVTICTDEVCIATVDTASSLQNE